MTEVNNESIRQLRDAIIGTAPKSTQPTYARATVTAAGSGGTWVRIEGADGVTPVSSSVASVQPGDTVTVRIGNGECAIAGNTTDAAVGQRVTQPIKQAAVEAVDVATAANESAAVAEAAAQTAHSAAQSAVQSAADAGRAAASAGVSAARAQAALDTMGDYDWESEDFDPDASLFYKDELGAHIVDARGADGKYRTDINSSGMEVTEIATGNSVASFGAGGARVGTENKAHTNISRNMFSIIGDDGNPTFQAEKGIVVIGNPYDNVQRFSADGFGFYRYTGTTTKWKQINTESDSSYTLVYIKSGTAWAEDDCLNVEITGNVQIPLPSDGDPSLTEVNPLVLEIDGEQVLVNAEIGRPKHVVESGARRTQWDIAWRYATNKSVSVSLFSEEQLGELLKFSKPVSGGYIFESIRAYLLKPTYEKTFSVLSDGSVETAVFEADKNGNVTASGTVNAAAYNIGGIVPFAVTKVSFPAFTLAASSYTNQSITVSDTNAGHPGADYRCAGILGLYNSHYSDATLNSFYLTNIGVQNPIVHAAFRARTSTAVSFADGECKAELLWIHKDAFKVVNN